MKKVFALCIAVAVISFIACGGGKDKEKEQKRADSLRLDSLEKVRIADSITIIEKEQKRLDSLRKDSAEKAEKKKENPVKPKKTPKKKITTKKPVKKLPPQKK